MRKQNESYINYYFQTLHELVCLLSEDRLHSAISKEKRWYEEDPQHGGSPYPFERALVLKNDLLKLKGLETYKSVLHAAKDKISKIGNALGLSRLLRTAKLYNIHKSRQYVGTKSKLGSIKNDDHPITKSVQILEALVEAPGVENHFFPEAETIANCIDGLSPLQYAYILYPPLSLLFLETIWSGKEVLRKKIKTTEGYYTDDGFALGFAYLFEVVTPDQGKCFDGISWHQSSKDKFTQDKSEMKAKATIIQESSSDVKNASFFSLSSDRRGSNNGVSDEDDEYTRLRVLAKRLEIQRKETELLHHSICASRMIFSYGTRDC